MPQIKLEARLDLDEAMDDLIGHIRTVPVEEQDGTVRLHGDPA